MYTSHGHHIPGTAKDQSPPAADQCGGVLNCHSCWSEANTFSPGWNTLDEPPKLKTIPITINGEIIGLARLKQNGFLEMEIGQGPANDELKQLIRDDILIELGLDTCLRTPAVPK